MFRPVWAYSWVLPTRIASWLASGPMLHLLCRSVSTPVWIPVPCICPMLINCPMARLPWLSTSRCQSTVIAVMFWMYLCRPCSPSQLIEHTLSVLTLRNRQWSSCQAVVSPQIRATRCSKLFSLAITHPTQIWVIFNYWHHREITPTPPITLQ